MNEQPKQPEIVIDGNGGSVSLTAWQALMKGINELGALCGAGVTIKDFYVDRTYGGHIPAVNGIPNVTNKDFNPAAGEDKAPAHTPEDRYYIEVAPEGWGKSVVMFDRKDEDSDGVRGSEVLNDRLAPDGETIRFICDALNAAPGLVQQLAEAKAEILSLRNDCDRWLQSDLKKDAQLAQANRDLAEAVAIIRECTEGPVERVKAFLTKYTI